jgi:hypothetical protein
MIDTASALRKLDDTWDEINGCVKTYGLRFISKKGFREIYNARKGVKNPQQQYKEAAKGNQGNSHKKFGGLVQIFDDDIKQFRDIKYANIVAFRDYKSKEWIRVRLT